MTSKHSPGPWSFQDHGSLILDARSGSSQTLVAKVEVNTYRDEGRYNARLIAAAPESHEANQLFVQAINEMQRITADQSDEQIYDEMPSSQLAIAYFAARSAIAKATGAA